MKRMVDRRLVVGCSVVGTTKRIMYVLLLGEVDLGGIDVAKKMWQRLD